MKINKKLFELSEIYETLSHAKTLSMLIDLKLIREEIMNVKTKLIEDTYGFGENVDEISVIDEQLTYLNKNIRVFENALMCHETKIIEKRTTLGELGVFYLN